MAQYKYQALNDQPVQYDEPQVSKEGEATVLLDEDVPAGLPEYTPTEIDDDKGMTKEPYRRIVLVTTGMFMGYAILVAFQRKLKDQMNIPVEGEERDLFQAAVSFLYLGNLIFRLAHNFIFFWARPRFRVYIALGCMIISMFIISMLIFVLHIRHISLVFVAYFFGGMGIGSFESNLLSAITPLGHRTKVWAIIGFPLGFAMVLVGGFCLSALGVATYVIYVIVLCVQIAAMVVFAGFIPVTEIKNNGDSLRSFITNIKQFRQWAPPVTWHCVALPFDMFAVSLFSGIMVYIFNGDFTPLFGPDSGTRVKTDAYFAVYNLFTLAGDSISRKVAYHIQPRNPLIWLVFSVAGAVLLFTKWAILAPLGIFLVFFANGAIYASTTRHIDTHVAKQYNLVTLSFWLFIGDLGSVWGSNMVSYLRGVVCPSAGMYVCVPK